MFEKTGAGFGAGRIGFSKPGQAEVKLEAQLFIHLSILTFS